jgi:hypothetical protein
MLWILLPVYAKTNFGLPESLYGWIPTTNALMCVFLQFPVTGVTRRYRPLRVAAIGMLVYAFGSGSVALMGGFWGFWLSMVVLTMGELILVPTASKYVADLAPANLRGRYMSVYWLSWGMARTLVAYRRTAERQGRYQRSDRGLVIGCQHTRPVVPQPKTVKAPVAASCLIGRASAPGFVSI